MNDGFFVSDGWKVKRFIGHEVVNLDGRFVE